jgi:hypothetical protein
MSYSSKFSIFLFVMDVLKIFIVISSKLLIVNFLFDIETWNFLSKERYSYVYLFPLWRVSVECDIYMRLW